MAKKRVIVLTRAKWYSSVFAPILLGGLLFLGEGGMQPWAANILFGMAFGAALLPVAFATEELP